MCMTWDTHEAWTCYQCQVISGSRCSFSFASHHMTCLFLSLLTSSTLVCCHDQSPFSNLSHLVMFELSWAEVGFLMEWFIGWMNGFCWLRSCACICWHILYIYRGERRVFCTCTLLYVQWEKGGKKKWMKYIMTRKRSKYNDDFGLHLNVFYFYIYELSASMVLTIENVDNK